jgi:hypothetical protein
MNNTGKCVPAPGEIMFIKIIYNIVDKWMDISLTTVQQ